MLHFRIIVLLLASAFSWLLIAGIGGVWGIVSGSLFFLLVLFLFLRKDIRINKEDFHAPLLASFGLLVVSIWLLVTSHNKMLLPIWVLLALAGVEEIVFWVVDKCYAGKSFAGILSQEFRLPPYFDLALAISLAVDLFKEKPEPSWPLIILILLLVLDFLRQFRRLL